MGEFFFTKEDNYYFLANGTAEYIDKNVTFGSYNGDKDLTSIPGNGIDTDANVETFLGLFGGEYANCTATPVIDLPDCAVFLNALFAGGGFGAEGNFSTLPADGRPAELAALTPLTQPYPDGSSDWVGVFAQTFTPTN